MNTKNWINIALNVSTDILKTFPPPYPNGTFLLIIFNRNNRITDGRQNKYNWLNEDVEFFFQKGILLWIATRSFFSRLFFYIYDLH